MMKRRALIWTGVILSVMGFLAIGLVLFISTLDQSKAKRYVSAAVSKATGRELSIDGEILLDVGWICRISASGIRFQNAAWSKYPNMAEVGSFDVQIDIWELLTKFRLVLPGITITQPKLILERNAEGAANWEFRTASAATDAVVPEKRTEFPVIQNVAIKDGSLRYNDQVSKIEADLKLIEAEAADFLDAPVKLKAEGSYQKQPVRLSLSGGSYQNLRSSTEPYPLHMDLAVGKVKAMLKGTLIEPLEMRGEDVTLSIQGDDMSKLYPIIRLVFPKTPPYRLTGRLKHEGEVWSFSNFSGRVGDSDLSGNIHVDTAPKRPKLKADLVSNLLDFDDLAGFIGGTPSAGSGETASAEQKKKAADRQQSDRLFPDQQYDLERLNAMDADVRLRAKKILAPKLPIDNLQAVLRLQEGVLRFTPAAFGVANGRMEIYSTFDASQRPSKVRIDARMRQLDLRRFMSESSFAQKTLSPISGRIMLSGTGASFRELMATASGKMFLAMAGGEISGRLIELAGLDVAESLVSLVRGDKSIPVRCALVDFEGNNGLMSLNTMIFDTSDTVIYGEGNIDLRDEKVNIVVLPVPKDFSPLSLRSYIRANGPIKDISVFPDPIKTGTDSLLKKIFNVLTMLVISPFQPRDLGQGKDIDCDALIAKVEKQDPQRIVLKELQKTNDQRSVQLRRHKTPPAG